MQSANLGERWGVAGRGVWRKEAGTWRLLWWQLLWSCLHCPATDSSVLYNGFIPVKIYSLLQLCKYEWNTDIIRFWIASRC